MQTPLVMTAIQTNFRFIFITLLLLLLLLLRADSADHDCHPDQLQISFHWPRHLDDLHGSSHSGVMHHSAEEVPSMQQVGNH
jgi:hypothetical protein